MLFCCLGAVMVLFYMVNWPDDDIRRYSWQIINSTISIFVAVLVFTGVDDYVITFCPVKRVHHHGHSHGGHKEEPGMFSSQTVAIIVSYALFMCWFLCLQLSIMYLSGASFEGDAPISEEVWCVADTLRAEYLTQVNERHVRRVHMQHQTKSVGVMSDDFQGFSDDGSQGGFSPRGARTRREDKLRQRHIAVLVEKVELVKTEREQKVKAYSTLFEHMTGFAAINMGGFLMNDDWFKQNWVTCSLAVVINQIFLIILYRITRKLRQIIAASDGQSDWRDEMCFHEVEEGENNIASLAASFQITQVMRFIISGNLPEISGDENDEASKTILEILGLYGGGLLVGSVAFFVLQGYDSILDWYDTKFPDGFFFIYHRNVKRGLEMVQSCCAMVAAWSFFFATRYAVSSSHLLSFWGGDGGGDAMGAQVIIAAMLSFFSCMCIRGLDLMEDYGKDHPSNLDSDSGDIDKVSKAVAFGVSALGLLVGFSWERAFDHGVGTLSTLTHNPALSKLVGSVVMALVIVPAWSAHIVSKVIAHDRSHKYQEQVRKEKQQQQRSGAQSLQGQPGVRDMVMQ